MAQSKTKPKAKKPTKKTSKKTVAKRSPPGRKRTSKDTQFKPGNPGGPGRPKGSVSVVRLMREALAKNGEAAAIEVAEALIQKAREGDVPAAREIMDRIDGRVTQKVDVATSVKAIDRDTWDAV